METRSHWEDSGYDCTYCGGQIYKRIDEELTGVTAYYQCRHCGAQWSLNNQILREGDRTKHLSSSPKMPNGEWFRWPAWVWVIIGFAVMFAATRAGVVGSILLRYLVPFIFIAIVGLVIFYLGRTQKWW